MGPQARSTFLTADTQYLQLRRKSDVDDDSSRSDHLSIEAESALDGHAANIPRAKSRRGVRNERRIPVAKSWHYLLTSLISLAVVYLQGRSYFAYTETRNITGAWPEEPNLWPNFVLFYTAVVAVMIDILAFGLRLSVRLLPLTALGRKAYTVC